jgi:hypothetical protein
MSASLPAGLARRGRQLAGGFSGKVVAEAAATMDELLSGGTACAEGYSDTWELLISRTK